MADRIQRKTYILCPISHVVEVVLLPLILFYSRLVIQTNLLNEQSRLQLTTLMKGSAQLPPLAYNTDLLVCKHRHCIKEIL